VNVMVVSRRVILSSANYTTDAYMSTASYSSKCINEGKDN